MKIQFYSILSDKLIMGIRFTNSKLWQGNKPLNQNKGGPTYQSHLYNDSYQAFFRL